MYEHNYKKEMKDGIDCFFYRSIPVLLVKKNIQIPVHVQVDRIRIRSTAIQPY